MADYALRISDVELDRYRMMAQVAIADEAAELRLAGVEPGITLADVGCGPAAMSVELSRLVGTNGSRGNVIAIEPDPEARATAAAVIEAAGVTNVDLRAGTATDTGLEPDSVDLAMMRHVLAHNGGHEQEFVDHLASRVRPGGTVYLVDVDLTGLRLLDGGPGFADMNERYVQFHRERGNDPQIGLRLSKLLVGAGLEVLTFVGRYAIIPVVPGSRPPVWAAREAMLADGVVTEDEVRTWAEMFEQLDRAEERPTLFAPLFVGVGRRRR